MNQMNTQNREHEKGDAPGKNEELTGADQGSGRLLWSVKSDLKYDRETGTREYGSDCLLVFEHEIIVADEDGIADRVDLEDINEVSLEELFGCGCVTVRTGQEKVLIYFTNAMLSAFGDLVRKLNYFLNHNTLPPETGQDAVTCDKCGNPLPEPGARCVVCMPRMYVLRRLVNLLHPYRARLYLVILFTFVAVAAQMAPPYITKHIVDDVIVPKNSSGLVFWTTAMIAAGLVFLFARLIIGYLSVWLSTRLVADLRSRLHKHLQNAKLDFYNKRSAGELVSRVMQDTTEIQQFLIEGLPYLLVNSLSLVAISIVLLMMDPWLALLVFLPVPVLIVATRHVWKKIYPMVLQRNSYRGRLNGELTESVLGVRAIKAAAREQSRNIRFDRSNERFFHSVNGIMRKFIGFNETSYWIMTFGVAIVWLAGALRLTSGDTTLTLGIMLAFVGYIWMFYGPLQWFGVVMNWMNNAMAGADRVFTLLDIEPERYAPVNPVERKNISGDIRFRDVCFSYENGRQVLKDVNLHIRPGEMIGLVGRSGAGKSTIINLICNYYKPESGEITLDGFPLERYRLQDLRHSIGIVMQDPFIFNGTVLDNIRYSNPGAAFEQVVKAAKAAHAHEFIVDKEAAYDTVIGENGVELSGGERQRIAIARAILQDPEILILDEATSLVDVETEKSIQDAMDALTKGRTTIAIAHRLATLRNAHRLIVIDEGRVAETGTHEELKSRDNGIYAGLLEAQAELNRVRSDSTVA